MICSTRVPGLVNFGLQTPWDPRVTLQNLSKFADLKSTGMAERRFPKLLHVIDGRR